MRIIHATNAYAAHSGGIRTVVRALGLGYRAAGHDFVLVTPGRRPSTTDHDWGRHVVLAGTPVPGSGGYHAIPRIDPVLAVLETLTPDRVEVSDRFSLRGIGRWATSVGVPSVVFLHEQLEGVLSAFSPLGARGLRRIVDRHNAGTVDRFDSVVTTTLFAARELARIGLTSTHIPLGVDLEAFRPPSRRVARSEPLLVLCSRLSREKRPELAIDALADLLRGGRRARLVIAGDGPLRRSLQRRAADLPVRFVGHLPDRRQVADLLGAGDVVLAPGPIETFGLAALEALACGTPVVASETSAVRELLAPGAGTCTAPDGPSIATGIREVLALPRAHRSTAARARAEEFPWERTTGMLLDLHRAARAA